MSILKNIIERLVRFVVRIAVDETHACSSGSAAGGAKGVVDELHEIRSLLETGLVVGIAPETRVRIDVDHLTAALRTEGPRSRVRDVFELRRRHERVPVELDVVGVLRDMSSAHAKNELIRFLSWNQRWVALLTERNRRTAVDTYDFIESEMGDAVFVLDQFEVLESKADELPVARGLILDLGVYKGASTRRLAGIWPDEHIHGFDSFEGLPDDWEHVQQGAFGDVAGRLPDVPTNVTLYPGWFDETLHVWASDHTNDQIGLLRVDCDIYSSTKTIFDELGHMLRPGSWIVFDELIGYRGWRDHEYRAFTEYLEQYPFTYEYVAYGLTYVIVRLGKMREPVT